MWVDVDAFEEAAERGDTEAALALYAGDLLPENRFDQWAEPRRVQVRAGVVRLLLDQAIERESRGDRRGAVASFERLVGIDPARTSPSRWPPWRLRCGRQGKLHLG